MSSRHGCVVELRCGDKIRDPVDDAVVLAVYRVIGATAIFPYTVEFQSDQLSVNIPTGWTKRSVECVIWFPFQVDFAGENQAFCYRSIFS